MGNKNEPKDQYGWKDGRPEMKYHGTMGVTLFLMVLLTGICLVYIFMMLHVAPAKVNVNREIVENEMFRFEIDEMGSFSNLSGDMLGNEAAEANPKAVWFSYGIAMLFTSYFPWLFILWFVRNIIVYAVQMREPFSKITAKSVRNIGFTLIFIAISKQLATFFLPLIWGGGLPDVDLINQPATVNCMTLGLLGLLFLFLSRVFCYGCELQEESDTTI